jgi:hypothetical protein
MLLCVSAVTCGITQAQMSNSELNHVDELNILRTKPKEYADILRNHSLNRVLDSMSVWILKNELIPLLDTMKPLPPLLPSDELRRNAERFSGFDTASGEIWHDLSYFDVSNQWRFGGQNLTMGPSPSARPSVIALLIDDCFRDRGHRKIFLHPEFSHISVRIIRYKGGEDKPLGSLFGKVYDLMSTNSSDFRDNKNDYPVSENCQTVVRKK